MSTTRGNVHIFMYCRERWRTSGEVLIRLARTLLKHVAQVDLLLSFASLHHKVFLAVAVNINRKVPISYPRPVAYLARLRHAMYANYYIH